MAIDETKIDSLQAHTFMQKCITLRDLCLYNGLDEQEVFGKVCESSVSFGTNGDTLITCFRLQEILGHDVNWGDLDNSVFISLGC